MKKCILIAALLLSATLLNAQSWAGKYTQTIYGDDGKTIYEGILYVIPVDEGASIDLTVTDKNVGETLHYDTDWSPIPINDNVICYYYPDEDFEYSLLIEIEDGCARITERTEDGNPYGVKVAPDGVYIKDNQCFVDKKGYLYEMVSATECKMVQGGIYLNEIEVPEKVQSPNGPVKVKGIDTKAFMGAEVTDVVLANGSQRVDPGAFNFTRIPYNWEDMTLPRYVYPDKSLRRFVAPEWGNEKDAPTNVWVIFKQNYAPAVLSADTRTNEDFKCARADFDFDHVMGLYYTITEPLKNMFRGYEPYEIEALVADQTFAAFHTFPSFGRWKHPEAKKEAPKAIVKAIAKKYGRTVRSSNKVAWLRDGTGEFDIVEFEITNGEAMVAFVWSSKGEIYASTTYSQTVSGDDGMSVWNVDDDGTYGIPDVVSIALDPDGYVNLFLAKNSPESIDCFVLHQVDDRFERIDLAGWYRWID